VPLPIRLRIFRAPRVRRRRRPRRGCGTRGWTGCRRRGTPPCARTDPARIVRARARASAAGRLPRRRHASPARRSNSWLTIDEVNSPGRASRGHVRQLVVSRQSRNPSRRPPDGCPLATRRVVQGPERRIRIPRTGAVQHPVQQPTRTLVQQPTRETADRPAEHESPLARGGFRSSGARFVRRSDAGFPLLTDRRSAAAQRVGCSASCGALVGRGGSLCSHRCGAGRDGQRPPERRRMLWPRDVAGVHGLQADGYREHRRPDAGGRWLAGLEQLQARVEGRQGGRRADRGGEVRDLPCHRRRRMRDG
jgi:hypothetical protein